ncbi:MAG: glycosyltransferase family 9 protein [Ignavibacteriales bacterium]|nr:glycosyltransferase family 9 protein [Ignavibacteriales bacterium]
MENRFQRILIVRTDRIGDVILTLPMAQVLKKHFPHAHIAMLIQQYTTELVEDNHCIDQIIYYDHADQPIPFFHLVGTLRSQRFDVVFHTHPRFRLAMMMWFARIPIRVGTGYRWYSFLFNRKIYEHRKDALYHELEYNLHLLNAIGCSADKENVTPALRVRPDVQDKVKKLLLSVGIETSQRIVIVHPGSGQSARDWSGENFGALGMRLSKLPEVKIIITGRASEQLLIERVKSIVGESAVILSNKLSLREFGALCRLASLFIANSTGPIHIAAAVGTPVIGLYPQITPQSANRWGPYTENKTIFTPLNKPIDCKECVNGVGNLCSCMASIGVDEVFEAAMKYLVKKSPAVMS